MDFSRPVSLSQEQFIGILGNIAAMEIMVAALAEGYPDKTRLWKKAHEGLDTKIEAMKAFPSGPEKAAQELMLAKTRARLQMLLDAAGCG